MVGAGLVGLLTAIELIKLGHIVTIYAELFPSYKEKDFTKKLSSELDEGLWLPAGYDMANKLYH